MDSPDLAITAPLRSWSIQENICMLCFRGADLRPRGGARGGLGRRLTLGGHSIFEGSGWSGWTFFDVLSEDRGTMEPQLGKHQVKKISYEGREAHG